MKKFFIWQDEIVIKTALNCGFTVELFSQFFYLLKFRFYSRNKHFVWQKMAAFKIYCKRLPNAFSKNSTMNFFTAIVFTSVNFEDSLIMNKTTEILFLLNSRKSCLFEPLRFSVFLFLRLLWRNRQNLREVTVLS